MSFLTDKPQTCLQSWNIEHFLSTVPEILGKELNGVLGKSNQETTVAKIFCFVFHKFMVSIEEATVFYL